MYSFFSKPAVVRTSIILFLIFILIGCGNNAPLSKPAITISVTETPPQIPPLLSMNRDTSFNLSSLNIQVSAFACPVDAWLYNGVLSYSGGNVVLTDENVSYDAGTIANLVTSLDKNDPSLLPNRFATALAGFVKSSIGD